MKVKDIMTPDAATATPETSLEEIAKLLVDHDCGAIPIVKSDASQTPVGMVTDRDIVTRVVAAGKDPRDLTAVDCMSSPCVTVTPGERLDACCTTMEENLVRRLVVVDKDGDCCGVVSQADIARSIADKAGEVVEVVSQPKRSPSPAAPREQPAEARH